jgi:hypothetical protein
LSSGSDLCDIAAFRRWVLGIFIPVGCYFLFLEYRGNSEFSKLCAFLGAFKKLQKSAINFVTFVRLSVRPIARKGKLDSILGDFQENCFLNIFRNSVDNIQVTIKSVCYMKTKIHF